MARCRNLIARDIEEILKLLHTTCPEVRELDITGCSDQVILRALSVRALSTLGASPLHVHERLMELGGGRPRCPFAAFLNALQERMRLLFDPAFAPAEGAFLEEAGVLVEAFRGVLVEACVAGNATAVVDAALLLGLEFQVDDEDNKDDEDNEGKTCVFDCNQPDSNRQEAFHFVA